MEKQLSHGDDYKYIPVTSMESGKGIGVAADLYIHTVQIVNIVFVGYPEMNDFVLVDTGMPYSADKIIAVAEKRFGAGCRPRAIVLTHGHFDHVGAVVDLVKKWGMPVYAHALEIPYLTGVSSYPDPDTGVEGGLVAKMSSYFPTDPVDLGNHIKALPDDGAVPFLPGFRWIHTPGHSPGHVSLFRDEDRALIVGDAFVTVKQEYLYKVLTQQQEISGPPRYLTTDWGAAYESVKILESLKPSVALTGHGLPMEGELLGESLERLVQDFDEIALPAYGRYIDEQDGKS